LEKSNHVIIVYVGQECRCNYYSYKKKVYLARKMIYLSKLSYDSKNRFVSLLKMNKGDVFAKRFST